MLADHDAQHVSDISEGIRSLKQHQLELIVEQRDRGSNLEIATVISHAAGEREADSKLTPVGLYRELGQAASHPSETAKPICDFSESVLQLDIQSVDNMGVEP